MRQGSNPKGRSRGRGGSSPKKPPPMRGGSFDGGGSGGGGGGGGSAPSARVRGNAHQLMDKYLALARDASAAGDRVAAENYFQHADHYYRVMNANGQPNGRGQRPQQQATPATPVVDGDDADDDVGTGEGDPDGIGDQPSAAGHS